MKPRTHGPRLARGALTLVMVAVVIGLAGAALGNHGTQAQSLCLRSKQPDNTVVTQSLNPLDQTLDHCGQWICNASVVNGEWTAPQPCKTPALRINITAGGTTLGVKPLTVAGGTSWTLTIYLKDGSTGESLNPPLTWTAGTDASVERTMTGRSHYIVDNMDIDGDANGAFELYLGDALDP